MTQPMTPNTPAATQPGAQPAPDDGTQVQGEGNYEAARRHRESVEAFIDADKVDEAAANAAPADAAEAQELRDAEAEGRAHAKR